jgi:hypothetical protein
MRNPIDLLGYEMYRLAGLDPTVRPSGGAGTVAVHLYGAGAIRLLPRALVEATLATVGGRRCIILRAEAPTRRLNFRLGEMLARLYLEQDGGWSTLPNRDERCRELGAWLAAPRPAFERCLRHVGHDIGALADAFALTWTATSLHLSELGGPGSVVTTPDRVYRKGRLLHGFPDAHVRELAACRSPRSVRRVVIRDEPGRVALFALAS